MFENVEQTHLATFPMSREITSWAFAAILSGAAIAVVLTLAATSAQQNVSSLQAQLTEQEGQALLIPAPANQTVSTRDFAQTLPIAPDAQKLLSRLQHQSTQQGVILTSLAIKTTEPSATALGKLDLSLVLRGAYAPVKDVFRELMAQPGAVLRRLVIRRQGTPRELEAQLELTLFSQPLGAELPAGR